MPARLPEIPGYRIERLLGIGGMAAVYLAIQVNLKRQVALKVMSNVLSLDARFRQRFLNEAQVIAQFRHPNVIGIYDSGDADGVLYMVTEYMDGGTLADRVGGDGMHPADAVHIVEKLAEVLDMAHEERVYHRDIKPENVLFDRRGRFVLADFGIAKQKGGDGPALTGTGNIVGTPSYMSPEQFKGVGADGRSDIYALGVMFHEMLTGRLPYIAPDMVALAMRHATERVPTLPPGLEAYQPMLERMLAKEPTERYQTCGELRAEIRNLITLTSALPAGRGPGFVERTTILAIQTAVAEAPAVAPLRGGAANDRLQPTATVATQAPQSDSTPARQRWIVPAVVGLVLAGVLTWQVLRAPGAPPVTTDSARPADTGAMVVPDPTSPGGQAAGYTTVWVAAGDVEVERQLGALLRAAKLADWRSALESLASADAVRYPVGRHRRLSEMLRARGVVEGAGAVQALSAAAPPLAAELLADAKRFAQDGQKGRPNPPAQNAVDAYRMVLALDPDNRAARQGLDGIVADYRSAAETALARGNSTAAARPLTNGLAVDPESEPLLALRGQIGED